MSKLQIKVTKAILNKSAYCGYTKEDGTYIASDEASVAANCAVALAIRDIFPLAFVSPDQIIPFGDAYYSHMYSEIQLPVVATQFIMEFDDTLPVDRKKMEPFDFEVEIPDDVLDKAFPIQADLESIFQDHKTLHFTR